MHIFMKFGLRLVRMRNLTLFLVTAVFVILCTFVIYSLEPDNFESLWNSFYFVMTTFSTVGYGDYSPATLPGKLFAVFMYLFGIGLLGAVIGKIIDALSLYKRKKEAGKLAYINENHIIIIGWGKKTEIAVEELLSSNDAVEIVIVDTLEKAPFEETEERLHYIQGDPTEEETFEEANISKAKSVIIFSDDKIQEASLRDTKTLSVAITVERLAPAVHTTVEVLSEKHIRNFAHVKVDEFILSEDTISSLAVRSSLYKGVSKVYSQLISRRYGEDLYKLSKKENWNTYQDAFQELLQHGATLIADRDKLDINRRLNERIPEDAELYVICNKETYENIQER